MDQFKTNFSVGVVGSSGTFLGQPCLARGGGRGGGSPHQNWPGFIGSVAWGIWFPPEPIILVLQLSGGYILL